MLQNAGCLQNVPVVLLPPAVLLYLKEQIKGNDGGCQRDCRRMFSLLLWSRTGQNQRAGQGKFTEEVSMLVVELYLENKDILSGKKAKRMTCAQKKKIWQEITIKTNAILKVMRTVQQIQKRIHDIKKSIRMKNQISRTEASKTGGGEPVEVDYTPSEAGLASAMSHASIHGVGGVDTNLMVLDGEETPDSPKGTCPVEDILMQTQQHIRPVNDNDQAAYQEELLGQSEDFIILNSIAFPPYSVDESIVAEETLSGEELDQGESNAPDMDWEPLSNYAVSPSPLPELHVEKLRDVFAVRSKETVVRPVENVAEDNSSALMVAREEGVRATAGQREEASGAPQQMDGRVQAMTNSVLCEQRKLLELTERQCVAAEKQSEAVQRLVSHILEKDRNETAERELERQRREAEHKSIMQQFVLLTAAVNSLSRSLDNVVRVPCSSRSVGTLSMLQQPINNVDSHTPSSLSLATVSEESDAVETAFQTVPVQQMPNSVQSEDSSNSETKLPVVVRKRRPRAVRRKT